MHSTCRSIVGTGGGGLVVDIECRLTNNLPTIVIVGFAGRAVSEAKDRIRAAFAGSKLKLPRRRITINLAPADIPKADSGLDAAIAVAILASTEALPHLRQRQVILGELGLDGHIRAVRGIIGKIGTAKQHGVTEFFVPVANIEQAQLIPGICLFPVSSLRQLHQHLAGTSPIPPVMTPLASDAFLQPLTAADAVNPFDGIIGQEMAKRAACITAAGGHNLLLRGAPGSGKSLIARAVQALLPGMNSEEMLEVTHLHSLANSDYEQLLTERPFRAPHHSTRTSALIGGGNAMVPGEISLSHRGVLLLDELPEFARASLEALRQPLEDKLIRITRSASTATFPADFILVATANPCPCGFAGLGNNRCNCSAAQLNRYRTKLSGPFLDRIDLFCDMSPVDHQKVLRNSRLPQADCRPAIRQARQRQQTRYASATTLNASLSPQQTQQYCPLTPAATRTLSQAATVMGMSTRALMRTLKIARTIADLEGCEQIGDEQIGEAIRYRQSTVGSSV